MPLGAENVVKEALVKVCKEDKRINRVSSSVLWENTKNTKHVSIEHVWKNWRNYSNLRYAASPEKDRF